MLSSVPKVIIGIRSQSPQDMARSVLRRSDDELNHWACTTHGVIARSSAGMSVFIYCLVCIW